MHWRVPHGSACVSQANSRLPVYPQVKYIQLKNYTPEHNFCLLPFLTCRATLMLHHACRFSPATAPGIPLSTNSYSILEPCAFRLSLRDTFRLSHKPDLKPREHIQSLGYER